MTYKFAYSVVAALRRRGLYMNLDFDQAVSAALLGVCLAARTFDENKGGWWDHAARRIRAELQLESAGWARQGLTCRTGGRLPPVDKSATPKVVPLEPRHDRAPRRARPLD
jgi:hypothetical protein